MARSRNRAASCDAQAINGMETSLLPIDVCEAIIDTVQHTREEYGMSDGVSFEYPPEQRTLMACALTCRAWSPRAQYHLRRHPQLMDSTSIGRFTTAARLAAFDRFAENVVTLRFGRLLGDFGVVVPRLGDFLSLSFPNLRALSAFNVDLAEVGTVFPRLVRARPALCQNVTRLMLMHCQFDTVRAMLDVVWSCRNVSSLYIRACRFYKKEITPEQGASMVATCGRLRHCGKLTFLHLDDNTFLDSEHPIPGGVFGSAVTELQLIYRAERKDLNNCIGSLPPSSPHQSLLHGLAASLAEPRSLREVTIRSRHKDSPMCCRTLLGDCDATALDRGFEMVLPKLAHLSIDSRSTSDDKDGPCDGVLAFTFRNLHRPISRETSESPLHRGDARPTILSSRRSFFGGPKGPNFSVSFSNTP
ncbi:hypothetical protein OH77DRAFT_646259 [Trametes cingulata]|nr:hypothetical protein OH77DRAFT_646259 [Trametes cingulata]